MKRTIILWSLSLIANIANAQCKIVGPDVLNTGQKMTYTIEADAAQCNECHKWKVNGDATSITSETKFNNADIKADKLGKSTLSLSIFTPNGITECSKEITVDDKNQVTLPAEAPTNCNIEVKNFREVRYDSQIVSFFPLFNSENEINQNDPNRYIYYWTATYKNGETKTSLDNVARFRVNTDNYITKIVLKVITGNCYKQLSKDYTVDYWKFFQ